MIVCSVVGPSPSVQIPTGLISAWTVDSLPAQIRKLRFRMDREFLPVAAFEVDADKFLQVYHLLGFPQSVWLGWMAKNFGHAVITPAAQKPIFRHYGALKDRGVFLHAAWELAAGLLAP